MPSKDNIYTLKREHMMSGAILIFKKIIWKSIFPEGIYALKREDLFPQNRVHEDRGHSDIEKYYKRAHFMRAHEDRDHSDI